MRKAMLVAVLCTITMGLPALAAEAPDSGTGGPQQAQVQKVQPKESKQKASWDWGNRKRASGDPHINENKARPKVEAKDAKEAAAK